jgi:hypothetical protein
MDDVADEVHHRLGNGDVVPEGAVWSENHEKVWESLRVKDGKVSE